jgi:hypothetical protein
MILRFFFNRMSTQNQIAYLRKKGVMLGTRIKEGRKIYIYMLSDLFIEVIYKNDNSEADAEALYTLRGLDNLNDYLEKEFRASF